MWHELQQQEQDEQKSQSHGPPGKKWRVKCITQHTRRQDRKNEQLVENQRQDRHQAGRHQPQPHQCHPGGHVITAWIALDDVDEDNGCLRYISGSQKEGIVPHQVVPGQPYDLTPESECIDLKRESVAPVRKGGVVFHHSETLHTSHRNASDRWRRGYATHWVTADVTSETDALERAYFHQPEYEEIVLEAGHHGRLAAGGMV